MRCRCLQLEGESAWFKVTSDLPYSQWVWNHLEHLELADMESLSSDNGDILFREMITEMKSLRCLIIRDCLYRSLPFKEMKDSCKLAYLRLAEFDEFAYPLPFRELYDQSVKLTECMCGAWRS